MLSLEFSGASLSDTPFARAIKLESCKGSVSVLDSKGVSWSRIWCGELYISKVSLSICAKDQPGFDRVAMSHCLYFSLSCVFGSVRTVALASRW